MNIISSLATKTFGNFGNHGGKRRENNKPRTLIEKFAKEHNISAPIVPSRRGIYSEADRPLVDKIWKAHGLTDRDNVQIFVVPKNSRVRTGSFIHRPTESQRTRRLMLEVTRLQNQLRDIEMGNNENRQNQTQMTEQEVARERHVLRREIATRQRALRNERARLANGPRHGFIVVKGNG